MSSMQSFAKAVSDLDRGLPNGMSNCMSFGMMWGCDPSCKTFKDGGCEVAYENLNSDLFKGELSEYELTEYKEKYGLY